MWVAMRAQLVELGVVACRDHAAVAHERGGLVGDRACQQFDDVARARRCGACSSCSSGESIACERWRAARAAPPAKRAVASGRAAAPSASATRARMRSISPMPCRSSRSAFEAARRRSARRPPGSALRSAGWSRERSIEPAAQLARAHRRDASIEQREQRRVRRCPTRLTSSSRLRRVAASRISASRALFDAQAADVRHGGLLRVAHVLQQRAGGADRERQLVGAEALEVERAELVGQQPRGARQLEVPGRTRAHGRAVRAEVGVACDLRQTSSSAGFSRSSSAASAARPSASQDGEAAGGQIEPGEAEALAVAGDRARAGSRGAASSSASSVTVPGVTTRTTWRSTGPFDLAGSPICSQIATDSPLRTSLREIAFDRVKRHAGHRDRLRRPTGRARSA